MSQITYFNVGVVAESYSNGALAYVDTQKGFIEDAADMLGMPAIMTAIAGAMAEENDSYGKDFGDETINLLSDYFALSAADPTQFFNRVMQFSDWKIGLAVAAAEFGVDLLPGTRRTHAQWQALYAQVNGQPDLGHGPLDKILNPVLMDMGQGNVKMATAIRLIETYQADATAVGINVAM